MSIDYYAVPERDPRYLEALAGEGDHPLKKIDKQAVITSIRSAIPAFEPSAGDGAESAGIVELNWEEDGYIQVQVAGDAVTFSHGAQGDELLMDTLMDLIDVLQDQGLHIWDAQNSDWM